MTETTTAVLVAATTATGLSAGLFFAFSCAVMPGLRRVDDRTFTEAMRRINEAILNGWFAAVFAGAPLLTAVAFALQLGEDAPAAPAWTVAALVLHGVLLGITFGVSIPLNEALAAAGTPDATTGAAAVRERFEAKWVRWNFARTVAATAALACLGWVLVLHGGS
ncbi:MAG TPA: DUF1772 domain-containing protein [Streptomyces sp.]|nr:DUF1772 domain-containing protein [Streptomyces sp.]